MVLQKTIVLSIILTCLKAEPTTRSADGKQRNLCSKTEKYIVTKMMVSYVSATERYTKWCFSLPPRCSKYRTVQKKEEKQISTFQTKLVFECCEGFKKVDTFGECEPICKNGCNGIFGTCINPNQCSCEEGWMGAKCTQQCPFNRYGKNCEEFCSCQNGAICDSRNGTCYCELGFTGTFCESVCPEKSFGRNCENVCKCMNGAMCDVANGTCDCTPGYQGEHCGEPCQSGTYGNGCNNICTCNSPTTESCNHVNGTCNCFPGWKGAKCVEPCASTTWGGRCEKICDCGSSPTCDPVTGACSCPPGYHGLHCTEKCPVGFYEKDCKMKCPDCLHRPGQCHHESGWCSCPPGTTGRQCDLECPESMWGVNCSKECLCINNSTCNSVTGNCSCQSGWIGEDCSLPCPDGMYGMYCGSTCNCKHNFTCNPLDGGCCEDNWNSTQCTNSLAVESIAGFPYLEILLAMIFVAVIICVTIIVIYFTRQICKKSKKCTTYKEENSRSAVVTEELSPELTAKYTNPTYESTDTLKCAVKLRSTDPSVKWTCDSQQANLNNVCWNPFSPDKRLTDSEEDLLRSVAQLGNTKPKVFEKNLMEPTKHVYLEKELEKSRLSFDFQNVSIAQNEFDPFFEVSQLEINLNEGRPGESENPQVKFSKSTRGTYGDVNTNDVKSLDLYADILNVNEHVYQEAPENVVTKGMQC